MKLYFSIFFGLIFITNYGYCQDQESNNLTKGNVVLNLGGFYNNLDGHPSQYIISSYFLSFENNNFLERTDSLVSSNSNRFRIRSTIMNLYYSNQVTSKNNQSISLSTNYFRFSIGYRYGVSLNKSKSRPILGAISLTLDYDNYLRNSITTSTIPSETAKLGFGLGLDFTYFLSKFQNSSAKISVELNQIGIYYERSIIKDGSLPLTERVNSHYSLNYRPTIVVVKLGLPIWIKNKGK